MSRARELSRLGNPNIIATDGTNVGFGTATPKEKVNVVGVVSATQFFGDGSTLEGIASAGIGTALSDDKTKALNTIYFTNDEVLVTNNSVVNPPDSGHIAYTQAPTIVVDNTKELTVSDGDDLLVDVLGISTGTNVDFAARGNGVFGNIYVDNIESSGGQTSVNFPKGLVSTGVATFHSDVSIGGTLTYEDVKNIDSVGLITARTGVRISGGGIDIVGDIGLGAGKQTGTSGQVLTSAGSGASPTWADVDALPSVSGTASGSITAGKAVLIKSDGNFEAVTGVDETLGAKSTGFSRTYFIKSTFDIASGKFVIVYADPANDFNPTSSVATISNTNAVSYGTKTSIQATNIGNNGLDVCYVANRSKVACVYRNGGSGIALERGTVSGTDITWDNQLAITNWNTAGSEKHRIIYNPDNNYMVVAYKSGSSGNGTTHIAEFSMASNGTITALANKQMSNQTGESMDICYDTHNDGYIVIYVAGNQSSQMMAQFVASGNGGAIPNPTSEQFLVGGVSVNSVHCVYDPDTNQIILLYQNTSTNDPYIVTVQYDGSGSWTDGTPLRLSSDGQCAPAALGLTYMGGNVKKVIATWGSSATDKVYVKTLIVNGAGFTEIPTVEVDSEWGTYGAISSDTRGLLTSKALVSYSDDDAQQDSYSKMYTPSNTNLSADTYLGFANNTVTNGQTVKVNTASNISIQSGLTTATKYYVSGSGGVTSTAPTPSVMAGIALNSTQMLIKSA